MPAILDRCVADLKKQGKSESQAFAICTAQLKKSGKLQGNVYPQIDLVKAAEDNGGEVPDEIELIPEGEWKTTKYPYPIKVDKSIMDKMVANFKAGHRAGVPIDTDHDEGAANGWIQDIYPKQKEDGKFSLFGKVEWNSRGIQNIKDKVYRFISPEFHFNFSKPLTGEKIGPTLLAATVTNRPLFNILRPIVGNEGLTTEKITDNLELYITADDTMNIDDILKKPANERTDEEKKFLADASLSDEQKAQLDKENKDAGTDAGQKGTGASTTQDNANAGGQSNSRADQNGGGATQTTTTTTTDNKTEGKEGNVTIKASEWEETKRMAEESSRKLRMNELGQDFDQKFSFNDKAKTGKVLPKGKDAFVKLMYTLSDDQVKLFNEVMESVPDKKLFGETGTGKDTNNGVLTASEKFEKLIDDKLKENKDLSYTQASEMVTKDNKALWDEMQAEIMKGKEE